MRRYAVSRWEERSASCSIGYPLSDVNPQDQHSGSLDQRGIEPERAQEYTHTCTEELQRPEHGVSTDEIAGESYSR